MIDPLAEISDDKLADAARRAAEMRVERSLLTITHSESLAMAQVMLFGRTGNSR